MQDDGHDGTGDGVSVNHSQPYSELAHIYDRVMDHVCYDAWERYIVSLFRHFDIPVESILEIACGTGSMTKLLAADGYRVTGLDYSLPMLSVASRKFDGNGHHARLIAADMSSLPISGSFDAVLCLYDSINYLCDESRFQAALHEAARVTRPGGVYIFDVCTVRNSQLFFSNHSMTESVGGVTYHRTSRYNSAERLQENSFVIEAPGWRAVENHVQRIYRLNDIRRMIANTPFELLAILDDMTVRPGSEQSERVHFACKRPPRLTGESNG